MRVLPFRNVVDSTYFDPENASNLEKDDVFFDAYADVSAYPLHHPSPFVPADCERASVPPCAIRRKRLP